MQKYFWGILEFDQTESLLATTVVTRQAFDEWWQNRFQFNLVAISTFLAFWNIIDMAERKYLV